MPWCDTCARFWNPSSVEREGQCPTCGRVLTKPEPRPDEETVSRAPWHFKLLMVALVIYLGYRAVQGIMWLVGRV